MLRTGEGFGSSGGGKQAAEGFVYSPRSLNAFLPNLDARRSRWARAIQWQFQAGRGGAIHRARLSGYGVSKRPSVSAHSLHTRKKTFSKSPGPVGLVPDFFTREQPESGFQKPPRLDDPFHTPRPLLMSSVIALRFPLKFRPCNRSEQLPERGICYAAHYRPGCRRN